jgi:hypothetical protein
MNTDASSVGPVLHGLTGMDTRMDLYLCFFFSLSNDSTAPVYEHFITLPRRKAKA